MRSKTVGHATAANNTGGATADYSTAAAWETSIADTDHETGTWIYAGQLDTSGVTINASNTGGWTYLMTADSASAITKPTRAELAAKARIGVATASQTALTIATTGVIWEKVGISGSSDSSVNVMLFSSPGTLRRTTVLGRSPGGVSGVITTASGTSTCSNVAIINTATNHNGFVAVFSGVTLAVYHCSVYSTNSPSYGAFAAINSAVVNSYACIQQGSGTGWYNGGTLGGDDNVSEDATAPGSNVRQSAAGLFRDTGSGTEDLRLRRLNGATLAGITDRSGTIADLATDMAGTSRPRAASCPLDPGCWMVPAGPAVLAYASSGAVSTSTSTTEVVSINVPSGTKLLVVVASGNDAILSADWNGTAMTAAAAEQNATGTRTRVFLLANPATGTHNATVTFTSCNRRWIAVYAVVIPGDANTPLLDVADGATGTGGSISKSTTTAVDNEGAIDILANSSSAANPVPNAPQGLRQKSSSPSFLEAATSTRLAETAGSTSNGWTEDTGYNISLSVVYIKPGSGGGGGSTNVVLACFLL